LAWGEMLLGKLTILEANISNAGVVNLLTREETERGSAIVHGYKY